VKSQLRLLFVEDSGEDAALIVRELRRGGYNPTFERVETRDAMSTALDIQHWDAVIADYSMPQFSGMGALKVLREKKLDIPFIIVSGAIGEDTAVSIMKAGASDFVMKSNLTRLSAALERELKESEMRSARKKAEEDLYQSEERFRAIFHSALDCIFLKDRSLKYLDVNPAMKNLLGISRSQLIGRTDEEIFPGEEWSYFKDVDRRVLAGEPIEGEYTRLIRGGRMIFHEVRVPLRNDQGQIFGMCGTMRDVTERRRHDYRPRVHVEPYPSEAMRSVLASVRTAADRQSTILILGESGSGKDYLARYIHSHSRCSNGPFFSINCAAVTHDLAESELFGHERGAFTGAHARKRGLLELAEGGTLLLNEIGELSLALQAKLLTFLDTRQFTRVGGEKNIQVNARLIAATNKDLENEVEEGKFRRDLFYRLNVVSITMPPLRRRREDVPVLAKEIMDKLRKEMQLPSVPEIDGLAMNALINYGWPGNVRELRNVLERAIIVSGSNLITAANLALRDNSPSWSFNLTFPADRSLNDVTRELKASLVNEALRRCSGHREDAARLLGISRHSLKHYIKSLGLLDEDSSFVPESRPTEGRIEA